MNPDTTTTPDDSTRKGELKTNAKGSKLVTPLLSDNYDHPAKFKTIWQDSVPFGIKISKKVRVNNHVR